MGVWILSVNNQDVALSSTDDSCSWLRPLWLWTDQFWSGLPVQVDKIYFLFVYCLTFVFFCGWTSTVSDWMSDVTFLSLALWSGWEWAEPVIWPRWNRFISCSFKQDGLRTVLSQQSVCVCVLSSEGIEPLTKQRPPLRPKGETCLFYYIFAISISELNWSYHVANC